MKTIVFFLSLVLFGASYGDCRTVTYSKGKFTLKGQLCRPKGDGPFPGVVYNHGGLGTIIGGAPEETCKALKKSGFVGFSPIRRPTKPLKGHMDDVMAAVSYLKSLKYVDKDRIGIMGFSRGGMLTYQAATRQNAFKAVVIMATAMGRDGRGLNPAMATNISAPVLLLVAKNDTGSRKTMGMNTVKGTKKLYNVLKEAEKDVELIIYPPHGNDGHSLFFSVGNYWEDIEAFLKQHL
ncbi:MAG: prolyl oligopeptidase family serine peptidase [Desulfobacula sp.]|nr:prolyl oligopeptidase family serine peptidase [Desulfobacula sp.]